MEDCIISHVDFFEQVDTSESAVGKFSSERSNREYEVFAGKWKERTSLDLSNPIISEILGVKNSFPRSPDLSAVCEHPEIPLINCT